MVTMAMIVAAGLCYWFAWYKLSFWILAYAIVYGGLTMLRGDNQARFVYRGTSGVTAAMLIPVAWHTAALAGYL